MKKMIPTLNSTTNCCTNIHPLPYLVNRPLSQLPVLLLLPNLSAVMKPVLTHVDCHPSLVRPNVNGKWARWRTVFVLSMRQYMPTTHFIESKCIKMSSQFCNRFADLHSASILQLWESGKIENSKLCYACQ